MKRKIMFMGRSGAGKTTLTQALYGEDIEYHKTQYVNYSKYIIDPPGEYIGISNSASLSRFILTRWT